MRTNLVIIAFFGIGLISILTSCEKNQIEQHLIAPTASELQSLAPNAIPESLNQKEMLEEIAEGVEKEEPIFSELMETNIEKVSINLEKSADRNSSYRNYGKGYHYQEVYSHDYHLKKGCWVSLHLDKHQVSPHYRYIAVVKAYKGDSDIYSKTYNSGHYGYNGYGYETKHRSSKRRGKHLDETWLHHKDFGHKDTHGAFYLYGHTKSHFKVTIFKVPTKTIWVRHRSKHYGHNPVYLNHNRYDYPIHPEHAAAIPYNHASSPKFHIWECKSSYNYQDKCGWDGSYSAKKNKYLYHVYDYNYEYNPGKLHCTYTKQRY